MSLSKILKGFVPTVFKTKLLQPPDFGNDNEKVRNEWVVKTLKRIPAGSRILDAGAGELRCKPWCAHLDYISQDFGEYNGQGDDRGLQTGKWDQSKLDIVCDIVNIPQPNDSFDAILCIEVFEHLPDAVPAVKEFSRLLKSGGKLILTSPFCSLTHFAPFHFATGFSTYWYEKHLGDNGFRILEITKNGNYFKYMAQELKRLKTVSEQFSHTTLDIPERISVVKLLKFLEKSSNNDSGSNELLYHGCHVFAEKI